MQFHKNLQKHKQNSKPKRINPETLIQTHILQYLNIKNIFHYRNNNTSVPGRSFNGMYGAPDIIAVIKGKYVGIEVKSKRGKQSPHQKLFQTKLEAAGGVYLLAYSIDDVLQSLSDIACKI